MLVESRATLVSLERAPTLDRSLLRAQQGLSKFQRVESWPVRAAIAKAPHDI
eukprot:SAG31_NODE_11582_length_1016_cov_1.116685_1_plen_52_part_00